MNPEPIQKQRDRNIVIIAQLGVLAFILIGLFSSVLFQDNNDKNNRITDITTRTPVTYTGKPQDLMEVSVRAKAAYVWDVQAQRVLFEKNADEVLPLASITKLMTSMLAYELLDTSSETTITSNALRQEGNTGFSEGEKISLQNLTKMALISSSNDAAFALAASVGSALGTNEPSSQFVTGMNIRAEELGFNTLSFKNPTGLDVSVSEAGAEGSAADVSRLLEHILLHYPEVLESTRLSAARVYNSEGDFHDVTNTNEAMYAIPNLLGSKTGYTDLAGGNLTIAYDAGFNRPIIVTVLGSTREGRFTDVLNLVAAVNESLRN